MTTTRNLKNPRRELLIDGVPADIKQALRDDATEQKISVNEAATRILADHYKVKHSPAMNGLRGQADRSTHSFARNLDSEKLTIRGGSKLLRKVAVDAARRGGTMRGVVLEQLALHYDLDPPEIGRRPRKKEAA